MEQLSFFDLMYEKKKITKPIKLIEFFAGIGAQHKALEVLGVDVSSHMICEWAYNSIIGYNAIHQRDFTDYSKDKSIDEMIERINGISINYNEPLTEKQIRAKGEKWIRNAYNNVIATNNKINIMNVEGGDLNFNEEDAKKYEFIATYSFPCQDLSLGGKGKGMSVSQANGGTRSGLLWEFERILLERQKENLPLPSILMMENVPQVIGKKAIKDFQKWEMELEELGYQNYIEILNAKDYGIPQNRERCFMISILGEYSYTFPKPFKREYKLKDFLEDKVDEKYYLSQKMLSCFMSDGTGAYPRRERFIQNLTRENQDVGNAVTTLAGSRPTDNFVVEAYGNKRTAIVESKDDVIGGGIAIKNATKKGYLIAHDGDGIDISGRMATHRGTVQKECCQTLKTTIDVGVVIEDDK